MNHTYRLIWSHRSHCFVAVGEHARGCGKSARGAALVIAAALAAAVFPVSPAAAGPTGGVVTQGAGSIARPDALTTAITQTSSRLAIDWTSFSSAAGERITFIQPDAFSIALNRVTGRGRSELMGSLVANGQVFLLNPNGVLFGPNASVDVGGLVASTLGMDTNSFMNGSQVLEGGGQGSVVNQGKLTATEGGRDAISGYIALVGPRVINEGAINAQQGQVLMAAGDKVTLTLAGRSLASYTIDRGSLNALVDNRSTGMISASGGQVTLDASAADKLSQAVVNHSGVIEAQTLAAGNKTGSIRLLGGIKSGDREAGDMLVDGTLDVSAPGGGDGGRVETSAARVNIAKSAQVSLLAQELGGNSNGTWTNASRDFLIAKGKGPETSTSIGATTLSQLLSSASRNPATPNVAAGTGDLYVNAPVAWESASKLTLSASRNIYVNADINASKGGSLTLEYGQGTAGGSPNYFVRNGAKIYLPDGDNFSLRFGKLGQLSTYRVISKPGAPGSVTGNDLQGISNAVNNGRYVLGADIDASATKTWNNGAGFVPIGGFNGILDGLGHTISNLYINSTQSLWVGLIRDLTSNGRVQNLTLENADISNNGSSPTTAVGALVGKNDGKIFNAHATMSIKSAYNNAGGLVGINNGEIRNSSAVGTVTFEGARDAEATGGLVGRQVGQVKSGSTSKAGGTIIDSYATVDVIGNRSVGGLVGLMEKSATGIENPTVTGSYAGVSADGRKGSVQGKENVGGLVGYLELGSISDSYAAVPVTGTSASASSAAIGGLVGLSGGTVQRAYARGPVRSDNADKSTVGGLIGKGAGLAFNSFWNTETTGQASSRGGADANGIDTAGMRNLSTFKGWDIDAEGGTGKTWRIYDGQTAPLLRSFLVTKDVEDKSVTYNNARQSGCTGMPCDSAAGNTTFSAASGEYAGTYTPYDLQQGYDIRGGKLTITPVLLTPSVTSTLEKVYDGKTDVYQQDLLSITPLNPGAVTLRYASAQYDNKNAADDRTVSFSGITLDGNSLGNYEIANTFSSGGKITKRALSLVDTKVNDREYDGSKSATLASTPASLGSLVNSVVNDDVSAVNAASVEFVTRNAGENKQVTVNRVTLGGTDAGNYSIAENITVETNARILRRALTLSDTKVDDREYDGTSNAVLNGIGTLNRTVAGDKVTASASGAAFADKTAATNKEVTVSGVVLA
ncbi:YDG domain-containing protein, partial [Noviherbaspirillum soli]|uniref:YDG domain-containing protein n=1 Tax=Noviherbaspirillum soli TaxID=1064518 RepID=UPI00188D1323